MDIQKPHFLASSYWAGLSERSQALYALIRPLPKAAYSVDVRLGHLEEFISSTDADLQSIGGSFDLVPDFQRGHVWTDDQGSRYIENLLRSTAPERILFNCPGWVSTPMPGGNIASNCLQCIDGLQRLTAVRKFMAGQLPIFGNLRVSDLAGTAFDAGRYCLSINIYEFSVRSDLLKFYLAINRGGTPHGEAEMLRIEGLVQEAIAQESSAEQA